MIIDDIGEICVFDLKTTTDDDDVKFFTVNIFDNN